MQACLSLLAPLVLAVTCFICVVSAEQPVNASSEAKGARTGRLFSAFNIVRFPNDGCSGSSNQNGTCYTAPECSAKGGKNAGSCAAGYGVCCIFTLNCGGTSSQNCTYFSSTGTDVGDCNVKICPCSNNICQLRLDFSSFVISGPTTLSLSVAKVVNGNQARTTAKGIKSTLQGNCLTDVFRVTNPGGNTPPAICGSNTGQHMYVDSSEQCNELDFQLGTAAGDAGSTLSTRMWSIKVTQYSCDFNNLAPQGCTQYFFGSTSQTVQTFNWDGGIHLANQNQEICIRRERGQCRICWSATNAIDFDVSAVAVGSAAKDTKCCQYGKKGTSNTVGFDCLIIPGGFKTLVSKVTFGTRFCGRQMGIKATTICTNQLPFNIRFLSDMYETFINEGATTAMLNKGFRVAYVQKSSPCTTKSTDAAAPVIAPDGLNNAGR